MIEGIVKWFSDEKGYGFVSANDTDYFIHFKEIKMEGFRTLKDGDKVCFEPATSLKGIVAKSLTVVSD